ncbi:MAG: hypothetical protein ACTHW2_04345 [Tissierella sp.]|uniref:hypothetical protein n=1 Tax=Tissierella sp. TaxID=41274 RepID=UPI003F9BCECF
MDYKDSFGNEIKKIYEEDVKDINLSPQALDKIIGSRKISLREKIRNFLNKEIEIPLAPAVIGFVLILGISIFPKGFTSKEEIEVIDFSGSQIIITSKREADMK